MTPSWLSFLRAQDLVWLAMFSALAWASPLRLPAELEMLGALAVLQLAAPRVPALNTGRGNLAVILLKLLLGFLLIGVTGGVASSYYLILLLPVVAAATTRGALATTLFTALACLAYLAFVPLAYNLGYMLEGLYLRDLTLRVLFLPVVAYLTYSLAEDNRQAALRAQAAAADLAVANRKLTEAEASVRRSERLAALGQLTAGLAHELRNPLGTIKASADLLLANPTPDNPLASELSGYISSEVDRTNALITRFLEFARPLKLRLAPVDLNSLADRAIAELCRQTPAYTPLIHRNYDPSIPLISADPELLDRVLFNLILNALQASPPDAIVTVRTRPLPDAAELAVLDRGCGIPPENREQIFNPFFTTKPDGVGLGLAICAKIVDEHNASLSVESDPPQGTVFLLRFPSFDTAPPQSV